MTHVQKITVFGGTGFIGRHLVRRLAKAGHSVRIPTRDPDKALFLKPMGDVGQIVPVRCNPQADSSVAAALAGADVVINLMGILYETRRQKFQTVHVEDAARLARLAKEHGVHRLLHLSALGAHSHSPSRYARTKALGEQAVRTFFPHATLFRPSIVFGPEDGFFNLFAGLARLSPILPLIGGGTTRFQPVYVGDVAEALVTALENPATAGQLYELAGPQIYTFRALLEMMLRDTGQRCGLVSIPWCLAKFQAAFLEKLPAPLLTRDQVELLKRDNIADSQQKNLRSLGLTATPLEIILPTYLGRFRK